MFEPLVITAELRNGFVSADPWSPAIDGILAYWLLWEQLGPEEFARNSSAPSLLKPAPPLPLLRVEWGDSWWYACSSPVYDEAEVAVRYYHRRFDMAGAITYTDETVRKVLTTAGPYKAYRNQVQQHITRAVQWHVLGNRVDIARILRRCDWIGAKGSQGYGRVERWRIEPGGDRTIAMYRRPLPAGYAEQAGLGEGVMLFWGLRPPVRLPEHKAICWLPAR